MTIEEFNALATACAQNIDQFNPQLKAYVDKISQVQKEDPCVKGFDAKLDEVDQMAESLNSFIQNTLNPSYAAAINAYNNLGFFDKRSASAVAQANTLINSIKAILTQVANVKKGGTRKELRERYNSCDVLKDPDEPPSEEETPPEDTESDGENQSSDDAGENSPPTEDPDSNVPSSSTTQSGKSGTKQADKSKKPNKRQKNPLGNLSSYTHNLTLYMITPEAYDAFVASGRKSINAIRNIDTGGTAQTYNAAGDVASSGAGAYILAQSGGANKQSEYRAPGFELDYYIDNLKLITKSPGSSTQTATSTTSVTFDIIEPYGFSFISNLTRARQAVLKNSKIPNVLEAGNNFKQIFVLGIRFYGYDKNGNVATTADFSAEDTVNPAAQAGGGGDTALFERFFDISIVGIKFKIDGKATVYNITANALPEQTSMTTRTGRINKDIQVQASTVEEALIGNSGKIVGLLTSLNNEWQALAEKGDCQIPNVYDLKFIGNDADVLALKGAKMVIDSDRDKLKSSMAATDATKSNEELSVTALPNLDVKQIKFKNDTAILQAISLIIGQSKYLFDAMNTVYTADPEDEKGEKGGGRSIKWYNLGADVKVLGFDTKRKEWAYKITYVIQPYETPYFHSPFPNAPIKYYGPHKRYDYYYTGENTEVIRYEQQLNGNFFTIALGYTEEERKEAYQKTPNQPQLAMQPQMRTPMARQGITGEGMEAQNSYLTSLYDPHAWASANITIMGDPDFLMNSAPNTISQVYDPYYGPDGFTINPNGGQVFIEIDFKEPQDYDLSNGLLTINESIQFVDLPDAVKKIVKGVSYKVLEVTSNFRGAMFTQDLKCNVTEWSGIIKDNNMGDNSQERAENARFARQGTGAATTENPSDTTGKGLTPAPGPAKNENVQTNAPPPVTETDTRSSGDYPDP